MSILAAQTPVAQLVSGRMSRARVFEQLGIDYCCSGNTPLARACAEKGLDVNRVLHELEASDALEKQPEERACSRVTMSELADHIVAAHHAYLRRELPRLEALMEKVARAHSERHPELLDLRAIFCTLKSEIESHMLKEEQVLFPFIKLLEAGMPVVNFHCGRIKSPISVMMFEHKAAGAALERMRSVTFAFRPPRDACASYQALLAGLAELEADIHWHVHKENNILFPRAGAAEAAFLAETS